jgi:antitoxin (DNA-binding transcriptional repressor) of toxin-antitoxin stability system
MAKNLAATEAVRNFSEILNTVYYRGEHYTIIRGGKAVAEIGPVTPTVHRRLGDLRTLLNSLPDLGEEAENFAKDLEDIIAHQPTLPKEE